LRASVRHTRRCPGGHHPAVPAQGEGQGRQV